MKRFCNICLQRHHCTVLSIVQFVRDSHRQLCMLYEIHNRKAKYLSIKINKTLPLFNGSDRSLMRFCTMRPKVRGLAQHGGPTGWLNESDPSGCDFVRDGPSMPPVLKDHPGLGCLYTKLNVHKTPSWATCIRHAKKAWSGTLVDPFFLTGCI